MISSLHRPTKAAINLDVICQNTDAVKVNIPQGKKAFTAVKANTHGHGTTSVAQTIHHLADGSCVSNIDEALELREAGIEETTFILGIIMPDEVVPARDYRVTLTVASQEWLDLANEQGISLASLDVHLKVDPGMGRVGVRSLGEAENVTANLKKAGANVAGTFTYFATADEADDTKFNGQLEFFTNLVNNLSDKPAIVHASSSATSIWHNETIFNLVRLGIVMYGLNPSGTELDLPYPLKPALSLESSLVRVKTIPAGATAGYGATYTAQKEEYIATVPIGYADGWTHDLQGSSVLVNDEFCEIIGRVSMNQTTIRLPEKLPIGTKVTLIGQEGSKAISATNLAQKRGTINYKIPCLSSDRIPRVYSK